MADLSLQTAQRLATLLTGSLKGMSFYPPGHPAVRQPLQEIFELFCNIFRSQQEVSLGVTDDILFFGEHLFVTPTPALSELTIRLSEKGICSLTVSREVHPEAVALFVGLLAQKGLSGSDLKTRMVEEGIAGIRLQLASSEEDDDEQVDFEARETYNKTLDAIRGVFQDIEKGRIPNSDKVIKVVTNLVTLATQDSPTLLGLSMIKDYDNYTFNHSVNVGILAMALGAFIGMSKEELKDLGMAGLLHDIGKTLVRKEVLNKPGKLSDDEFAEMKRHSQNGLEIISKMEGINPQTGKAVLGHHIQHNRQGYPEWARGEAFDAMPDILAVADTYDALTTLRVYQQPHTPKAAIDKLRQLAGIKYDPVLVEKFVEMMGSYPMGTLVRLDTNELAVVFRPNPGDWEAPTVKVIIDGNGNRLAEPTVKRLAGEDGKRCTSIVAVVDPMLKNIDIPRYLS